MTPEAWWKKVTGLAASVPAGASASRLPVRSEKLRSGAVNRRRRKGGGDPPPEEPIHLRIPVEEARRLLDQQIAKGDELLKSLTDKLNPTEFTTEARGWHDYNRDLISRRLFGSERAITETYNTASIGPLLIDPDAWEVADAWAKDIHSRIQLLKSLRGRLELLAEGAAAGAVAAHSVPGTAVFLIHGHDVGALDTVARYLESLGLDVRILKERPTGGAYTVIEKLEKQSEGVGYAAAIVTPDDPTGTDQRRARQNVIFELGYFVGKLGRERVTVLRKGSVEWLSVWTETSTFHWTSMTGGRRSWLPSYGTRESSPANIEIHERPIRHGPRLHGRSHDQFGYAALARLEPEILRAMRLRNHFRVRKLLSANSGRLRDSGGGRLRRCGSVLRARILWRLRGAVSLDRVSVAGGPRGHQ